MTLLQTFFLFIVGVAMAFSFGQRRAKSDRLVWHTFRPVPGYGTGRLDKEGNLAAYVDRLVLGEHTWKHNPSWDPIIASVELAD